MRNHKSCMKLLDLYRSYLNRNDQDYDHQFKLMEDEEEVYLAEPDEEGDVKICDLFLSEFDNPLEWLKSLRVVQVTTVVANGKVVPVKKQKGKHL